MVPGTPVLQRCPTIRETLSRSYGTLSYAIHTVHVHGVQLPDSVPVDTGTVELQMIMNVNNDLLRLSSVQYRPQKQQEQE